MRIITNDKLVKRNSAIGRYAGFGGLLIMGVGVYFSFQDIKYISFSFGALLIGFALSQIGIYMGNRYGRRPRPDEQLNTALKGLNKDFTIYHYLTAVPHLLIGPAGIWALYPKHHRGRIVFEKGKWKQKGGGAFLAYMKLFGQEGLGRPDLEITGDLGVLEKSFEKDLPDLELPTAQAILIFTNDKAELESEDATSPTIKIEKLKPFVRQLAKKKILAKSKTDSLIAYFEGEETDEYEDAEAEEA